MSKLKIFVGSSATKLDLSYAAQENLDHDFEVTVWTQDVFKLNKSNLESLLDVLNETDAGIFILAPDDVAKVRGKEVSIVRDNVIFELGLFIGKLGRERAFILVPKGDEELQLPSDLLGINPAAYEPARTDGNLTAALGPSCNRIRRALAGATSSRASVRPPSEATLVTDDGQLSDDDDCLNAIQTWIGSRPAYQNTHMIRFNEVDRELRMLPGTAKKLIVRAAAAWGYSIDRQGSETILFKNDRTNGFY